MTDVDQLLSQKVYDRYLKREILGEGTYDVVYKAIDTKTGKIVAIKKIRLGKHKEGVNFTALREIKLLKELNDPNIIEFIDAFPHKGNLHLVFEFMETDMEVVIRDRNIFLSPADIKSYIQMTLKGLAFFHRKWILHRYGSFIRFYSSGTSPARRTKPPFSSHERVTTPTTLWRHLLIICSITTSVVLKMFRKFHMVYSLFTYLF